MATKNGEQRKNPGRKLALFPLAYLFAGVALYGSALGNQFLWDDEEQIINNAAVHSLSNIWSFFLGSTFNSGGMAHPLGVYYKPLMTTAFALLWSLFGADSFYFHAFQLLLHIGSAVLLASVLLRWVSPWIAHGAAFLFLLHPMNLECVFYSSDLQDTLFFFFGMLALFALARRSDRMSWKETLAVSALSLCSLLSKETGILFLMVLPVYAYLFRRRAFPRVAAGMAAALFSYFVLRFGCADLAISSGELAPIGRASFGVRMLTLPKILFYYWKGFFYPVDYAIAQHWVVASATWSSFWFPLAVDSAVLGALLFLAVRLRDPRAWFFFFWGVVGMGMHSQVMALDLTVAERWFYFPMAGLLGLLAVGLEQMKLSGKSREIWISAGIFVLLGLGVRTWIRSEDWKDGYTLFTHDVVSNPDAFDLQNNVGVELFRRGKFAEAKEHFQASVRLAPHWWSNWSNLGAMYEREGDLQAAEAAYLQGTERGGYYLAYENLAKLLIKESKFDEANSFLRQKALPVFPNNPLFQQIEKQLSEGQYRK